MSARKPVIRFTFEADDDFESISLFTWQTWGEEQAATYEAAIARTLELLREHPQAGRPRDDLFPGCHSIQAEHHVIYFHQPRAGEIEVLRILHHRQDASAAVQKPPS
jgi:toxin ParE1/3/4